jgi:hypothetical protein
VYGRLADAGVSVSRRDRSVVFLEHVTAVQGCNGLHQAAGLAERGDDAGYW